MGKNNLIRKTKKIKKTKKNKEIEENKETKEKFSIKTYMKNLLLYVAPIIISVVGLNYSMRSQLILENEYNYKLSPTVEVELEKTSIITLKIKGENKKSLF